MIPIKMLKQHMTGRVKKNYFGYSVGRICTSIGQASLTLSRCHNICCGLCSWQHSFLTFFFCKRVYHSNAFPMLYPIQDCSRQQINYIVSLCQYKSLTAIQLSNILFKVYRSNTFQCSTQHMIIPVLTICLKSTSQIPSNVLPSTWLVAISRAYRSGDPDKGHRVGQGD